MAKVENEVGFCKWLVTWLIVLMGSIVLLAMSGCSSSGGGQSGGYTQASQFLRDMKNEHIGAADTQYQRVGKDPALVGQKSWNVLYCPAEGSSSDMGDYGCNCQGAVGACIHGWDSTDFGGTASTRLYAGPQPKSPVIIHEEAHATIARWADNPAEVNAHPTGHPSAVHIGGKLYNVNRDIIPGIRWPLIFRGPVHFLDPRDDKDDWDIEGCGWKAAHEGTP